MIRPEDNIFDITEKYPETIALFVSNGFPKMGNPAMRTSFGKKVSIAQALKLKNKNVTTFLELLNDNLTSKVATNTDDTISIIGALPCPVKIPLIEAFDTLKTELQATKSLTIKEDFKAASIGLDWIEEYVVGKKTADEVPDLIVSAGFDLFFEDDKFGHFRQQGTFSDQSNITNFNKSFDRVNLQDPDGNYAVISVVPAVFLVNGIRLKEENLDAPTTWSDLLKPEFEGQISLPVDDFDMFNAILLTIQKLYGDNGIKSLKRNMCIKMHPAEMVKSEKKEIKPAVTVTPYFFTRMIFPGSSMKVIWPEDGAIISPIFMLAKKEKTELLKPLANLFASKETGEILSHRGLFPSVRPDVDNKLPESNKFIWLGWDYINQNNIGALLQHCKTVFENC